MEITKLMNSVENLKHQKLRNNEYYSFQEIQDNLYARCKKGEHFKSLRTAITSHENILLAYRNIKNNSGSKTKRTEEYNNLIIVCDKVHILIHAIENATIEKYLNELMLEKEEMKR